MENCIPSKKKRKSSHKERDLPPKKPTKEVPVQQEKEDQPEKKYARQPRFLPDISGVYALTKTEIKRDLREMNKLMHSSFRGQDSASETDDAATYLSAEQYAVYNDELRPLSIRKRRSGGLPGRSHHRRNLSYKGAVKLTQRELRSAQNEKRDLELKYFGLRANCIKEIRAIQNEKKKQDKVLRVLKKKLLRMSDGLEANNRRNTAMQAIIVDMTRRGEKIAKLEYQVEKLSELIKLHKLELPNLSGVDSGDIVETPFGNGKVKEVRPDMIAVIHLDNGCYGYFNQFTLKVVEKCDHARGQPKPDCYSESVIHWVEMENALKKQMNRDPLEDFNSSDEDSDADDGDCSKRLIPYDSCVMKITPYDVPLLLSPLSELPEKTAAIGTAGIQWLPSMLPSSLNQWEQERTAANQLKGDLERLRFQVSQSESQKKEAQKQMREQREYMNELINDMHQLRQENRKMKALMNEAKIREKSAGRDKKNEENENEKQDETETKHNHKKATKLEEKNHNKQEQAPPLLSEENSRRSLRSRGKSPHGPTRKLSHDKDDDQESRKTSSVGEEGAEATVNRNNGSISKTDAVWEPQADGVVENGKEHSVTVRSTRSAKAAARTRRGLKRLSTDLVKGEALGLRRETRRTRSSGSG